MSCSLQTSVVNFWNLQTKCYWLVERKLPFPIAKGPSVALQFFHPSSALLIIFFSVVSSFIMFIIICTYNNVFSMEEKIRSSLLKFTQYLNKCTHRQNLNKIKVVKVHSLFSDAISISTVGCVSHVTSQRHSWCREGLNQEGLNWEGLKQEGLNNF